MMSPSRWEQVRPAACMNAGRPSGAAHVQAVVGRPGDLAGVGLGQRQEAGIAPPSYATLKRRLPA
jgi:hypothetical protein